MLNPVGNINLVFEVPKNQYQRFCEVTLKGTCHPESQSYNAGKIDFIEEATLFSSSMIVCRVWYRVSSCAGDPKHWSEFYRSLGVKWYDRPMETTSNLAYVPFFGAMAYPWAGAFIGTADKPAMTEISDDIMAINKAVRELYNVFAQ